MTNINPPESVQFVLQTLNQAGFQSYVVGGAVRDTLMNKSVNDWDFTTNALPEQIRELFPESFYDNSFGTVGISIDHIIEMMKISNLKTPDDQEYQDLWQGQVFEITTFRKEYGYTDKRRPDKIVWGETIEDDLARRDFTINAIALEINRNSLSSSSHAYRQAGRHPSTDGSHASGIHTNNDSSNSNHNLIDPYDGKKDIDQKTIRAVGDPAHRFQEDALRMLRAIRFAAQLGFTIEPETLKAISTHNQNITHISQERIRDELLKLIASDHPADGILMLFNSGLLQWILPELIEGRGVQQGGRHKYDVWKHGIESLRECPSTDPIVRLATLLHDIGKPKTARKQGPRGVTFYGHEVVGARMAKSIARRLRLPNKDVDRIFTLVRWHMFTYNPEMTDAAIRRFMRRVSLENINDMMLLRVGDRKGGGSRATSWRLRELQQRIGENLYQPMSIKDLKISGHDIMQTLNITPGPQIGQILNTLFEEVLEDPNKNTLEYLLQRTSELAQKI